MDTTQTKCTQAYHALTAALPYRVFIFNTPRDIWGEFYDLKWGIISPEIAYWSGTFLPPGSRVMSYMNPTTHVAKILTVGPHQLEKTVIHEALHAAGYMQHDNGAYFSDAFLSPCMNPASRTP
jgi:hypothetical protein